MSIYSCNPTTLPMKTVPVHPRPTKRWVRAGRLSCIMCIYCWCKTRPSHRDRPCKRYLTAPHNNERTHALTSCVRAVTRSTHAGTPSLEPKSPYRDVDGGTRANRFDLCPRARARRTSYELPMHHAPACPYHAHARHLKRFLFVKGHSVRMLMFGRRAVAVRHGDGATRRCRSGPRRHRKTTKLQLQLDT
jgi:hypothetical protein